MGLSTLTMCGALTVARLCMRSKEAVLAHQAKEWSRDRELGLAPGRVTPWTDRDQAPRVCRQLAAEYADVTLPVNDAAWTPFNRWPDGHRPRHS